MLQEALYRKPCLSSHKLHVREHWNKLKSYTHSMGSSAVVWFLSLKHPSAWHFRCTQSLDSIHLCWLLRNSHLKVCRQGIEAWLALLFQLYCGFLSFSWPAAIQTQSLWLKFASRMVSSKLGLAEKSTSSGIVLLESWSNIQTKIIHQAK